VAKAQAAGRQELATAAQERVDTLLREGNQLWGKMQGIKERTAQTTKLIDTIKVRRQELKVKAAEVQAAARVTSNAWERPVESWRSETSRRDPSDPLEAQFLRWEAEEELAEMKKKLGK
jgi:uncharacterized protein (TIGR04376 family)